MVKTYYGEVIISLIPATCTIVCTILILINLKRTLNEYKKQM